MKIFLLPNLLNKIIGSVDWWVGDPWVGGLVVGGRWSVGWWSVDLIRLVFQGMLVARTFYQRGGRWERIPLPADR